MVAGRQTTTVEDAKGRLESREEKDIDSGLVLNGMSVEQRDAEGRPTLILYSDGTTEEKDYSCCGLAWQKNRDGTTVSYTYDDLGRMLTETRGGVTTVYEYDGSGRVLTVTRRGSDQSEIVVETNTYDLAGRLTSRKDGMDRLTAFTETHMGNGQTERITTLPDTTSQRIEITHRDGQMKSISGVAAHPMEFEYGTATGGLRYVKEIRIGTGASTSEWTRTYRDVAGRTVKVEYPDAAEETRSYNSLGQLEQTTDPDGVTRLFAYNALGEQEVVAVDADNSGTITAADRRQRTLREVISGGPFSVLERTTHQEGTAGGYQTVAVTDRSPNGWFRSESRHGLPPTVSEVTIDGQGGRIEETVHPDNSVTVSEYQDHRLVFRGRESATSEPLGSTTFEYDPHGRMDKEIDGRLGTQTIYGYNDADEVTSINRGGMVTGYDYNALGQLTEETLPGTGRVITRTYRPTGELLTQGGSATYPVSFDYDPQGRRTEMVTSSGDTIWQYDPQRGWLSAKLDDDSEAVSYTYTDAGSLETRQWARGIVTTYGYNAAGELVSTTYSDGTPSVHQVRDERGRVVQVTDAAGTRSLTYNDAGQLLSDSIFGGPLHGVTVQHGYDSLLRKDGVAASRHGAGLVSVGYGYDDASRLETVTSGAHTATYEFLANSRLVEEIDFASGSGTAMTTTRTYDSLDRLGSISSAPAVGDPVSYGYSYNAEGQRDEVTLADGSYWDYGYNSRGEVTSGGRKLPGGTPLNGYQFGYTFDNIGNRTQTVVNGRSATYTPNNLNQYLSRTVPGYVNVVGKAKEQSAVTVNGQAAGRQGEHYHRELSVSNSSSAVYLATEVEAQLDQDIAVREGSVFVPETPEAFTYDEDGNLLSDGRWNYVWNGENRLVEMETTAAGATAGAPRHRLTFAYDYRGRRISKQLERNWDGSEYTDSFTKLYIHDGWNLIAEVLDGGALIRSYAWGTDLSGSAQGAGGVGGLLFINQYPENKTYSVGYDGNGNVTGLFDMAEDGAIAAYYEYGPFGEPLVVTGIYAEVNPIRWSTKYEDRQTGLVYYGFRYYNPETGRWLNRDPIEEEGGLHLYGFVGNDPVYNADYLGLYGRVFWKYMATPTPEKKVVWPVAVGVIAGVAVVYISYDFFFGDDWQKVGGGHAPVGHDSFSRVTESCLGQSFRIDATRIQGFSNSQKRDILQWIAQDKELNPPDEETLKTWVDEGKRETFYVLFHYDKSRARLGLEANEWLTNRNDLSYSEALSITNIVFEPTERRAIVMYSALLKSMSEVSYRGLVYSGVHQWQLNVSLPPSRVRYTKELIGPQH